MSARLRAARGVLAERRARRRATVGGRVAGAAALVLLAAVVLVGAVAPPEHCPTVTRDDLRTSATAAVAWFTRNQATDGRWLYQYDRDANLAVPEPYNVVRHAGAILGLEQAATAGIPGARESADRGVAWIERQTVTRDEWTAVSYQGEVAVGTSALLVAALAERRAATGATDYDDLMRRLGRFMESQVEPSGAVLAYYDLGTGEPVPDTYSKYYTGEAYWALTRLHGQFPDEGWDEPADAVGHYLATERDDAEGHRLAIPDHWAAYGLSETVGAPAGPIARTDAEAEAGTEAEAAAGAGSTGEPEAEAGTEAEVAAEPSGDGDAGGPVPARALTPAERGYARHQAGAFGAQVRWFAQRFSPWGVVTRGFRGVPRGGGYGVVGEALSGLWRVSRSEPALADIEGPVAERALCNAGQALEAQSGAEEAARFEDPGRVEGAWFRDGETRMDDQQHMISALLRTEAIAEAGPAERKGPAPPFWLWFLVLVAAFNPLRVALATRLPEGRRPGGPTTPAPVPAPATAMAVADPAAPAAANRVAPSPAGPTATADLTPPPAPVPASPVPAADPTPQVGPRRGRPADVALGGAAGAATAVVVALLASPLTSLWHVSPPALRLTTGALGLAGGLAAVLVRPLSAAPIAAGRAGAVVPIAVAVAHPVLLLAALSATTDRGLPVVVAALVTAVATLVAAAATAPRPDTVDQPPPAEEGAAATPRLLAWGARLTGLVLVAGSVALIIDAVYSP